LPGHILSVLIENNNKEFLMREANELRKLSDAEMLSLTELLQMETNALTKVKAARTLASDQELQRMIEATILAAEGRIKGIQQFINENDIVRVEEVH
jgi:hypothetical protein